MGGAYYNEIDPYAAQWLRNLISKGYIAPGIVDERSIEDVCPKDLKRFSQCHFFAGIGVWSYALRKAGWTDDREVWTGSCPCQPFSEAGQGAGFADERHLWPAFFHLIGVRNPAIVFGEQVSSKAGLSWFDLVCSDMEGAGYAVGAADLCAAGVGAPNIRHRLFWVAYSGEVRRRWRTGGFWQSRGFESSNSSAENGRVADTVHSQRRSQREYIVHGQNRENSSRGKAHSQPRARGEVLLGTWGAWKKSEWLIGTDNISSPVEPGTRPVVDGHPKRVAQVRAYGNAINAEVAKAFIKVAMECAP